MIDRYSNKIHTSPFLTYERESVWLSPEQIQNKPNLNGILNRILFSIKLLNFILKERDKHVNDYRKKMCIEEKLGDTWSYLILLTESYFSYVTTILNAYAELIYELGDGFPENTNGNFSELWAYVRRNSITENNFNDFFKNKMNWYEVFIRLPRNKLVIHDKDTSGYGMNDHGIDIYVGKHGNHDKEKSNEALRLVSKIIQNHSEFKNIQINDYFHPVYRQILEKIDILSEYEVQLLVNACGIGGVDFPYIPQVNPKLQEFMDFIEKWLKNKFLMCPQCNTTNLRVNRIIKNPQIRQFDPENVWFGWTCTLCHYMQEFNLKSE